MRLLFHYSLFIYNCSNYELIKKFVLGIYLHFIQTETLFFYCLLLLLIAISHKIFVYLFFFVSLFIDSIKTIIWFIFIMNYQSS